jgi:hypothetical protein
VQAHAMPRRAGRLPLPSRDALRGLTLHTRRHVRALGRPPMESFRRRFSPNLGFFIRLSLMRRNGLVAD